MLNFGGFNPSEKYARQIGSSPQIGVKIESVSNHHLVNLPFGRWLSPRTLKYVRGFPKPTFWLKTMVANWTSRVKFYGPYFVSSFSWDHAKKIYPPNQVTALSSGKGQCRCVLPVSWLSMKVTAYCLQRHDGAVAWQKIQGTFWMIASMKFDIMFT